MTGWSSIFFYFFIFFSMLLNFFSGCGLGFLVVPVRPNLWCMVSGFLVHPWGFRPFWSFGCVRFLVQPGFGFLVRGIFCVVEIFCGEYFFLCVGENFFWVECGFGEWW